jgi:hypothetical protein
MIIAYNATIAVVATTTRYSIIISFPSLGRLCISRFFSEKPRYVVNESTQRIDLPLTMPKALPNDEQVESGHRSSGENDHVVHNFSFVAGLYLLIIWECLRHRAW